MTRLMAVVICSTAALALVLAWPVLAVLRPRALPPARPALFLLLISLCLLGLRLPQIRWPYGINIDEANMVAEAMRSTVHPVPWQGIDGTTSGPLNILLLGGPIRAGAPPDWSTARLTTWAANCLTLVLLYLALRVFGGVVGAQFLLVPAVLFYAFTAQQEFAHYSSETLPVLMLSGCLCLMAREWAALDTSKPRLFALGVLCGAIPFAKLQAAPLALYCAGAGLALVIGRHRAARSFGGEFRRQTIALCLGVLTVPVLILGCVAAAGALRDFWTSYILAAAVYTHSSPHERLESLRTLLLGHSDIRLFLACGAVSALLLAAAVPFGTPRATGVLRWPLAAAAGGLLLAVFCLSAAGKPFLHYDLLLVPFVELFIGLAFLAGREILDAANPGGPARPPQRRAVLWTALFVLLVACPQFWRAVTYPHRAAKAFPSGGPANVSLVARFIRAVAKPGDTLAIWGWMPGYYVETGLMPATRDAIGHYVITQSPYRDFFQRRYLADLEQSRPAFFIDAVADGEYLWWNWRRADAHESFPALAAYVADNYGLWLTLHQVPGGVPVRIYVRKDRAAERNLAPQELNTPIDAAPTSPAHVP
jgi:hypothetical protein